MTASHSGDQPMPPAREHTPATSPTPAPPLAATTRPASNPRRPPSPGPTRLRSRRMGAVPSSLPPQYGGAPPPRPATPRAGGEHDSGKPTDIDLTQPNAARMDDFLLGGAHNFAADRQAALAVLARAPQVRHAVWANRRFAHRAVRYALDQGIRQFLDIGCGIPTTGGLHEIVHAARPDGRVLYVDADPVVVEHLHALLEDTGTAGVIHADLRQPATILDRDRTHWLIDFAQPVAVLLGAVLHFIPGPSAEVAALVDQLMRPAVPGSLLALSHSSTTAAAEALVRLYTDTTTPLHPRTPAQIRALFGGLTVVTPNPFADTVRVALDRFAAPPAELVPVTRWRPNPHPAEWVPEPADTPVVAGLLAGVGRKPPPAVTSTAHSPASAARVAGVTSLPRNTRFPSPAPPSRGVSAARS